MSQRNKDWNLTLQEAHDNYATKVTTVGAITYIGLAKIGTVQKDPYWQAKKVDSTSDVVITWADGNDNFDNIATDLTALSYS